MHRIQKSFRIALGLMAVVTLGEPMLSHAQHPVASAEVTALMQEGAIVHRRITMLARRVQVDLRDSRRFGVAQRAACLNDVLSDLHSTQRALDAWTGELQALEHPNDRLRGMLSIMRTHLKELRAEARGCFGGGDLVYGVVRVEAGIDGPQPDEDPHSVPQAVVDDLAWGIPQL